jgi:hypothetical protein
MIFVKAPVVALIVSHPHASVVHMGSVGMAGLIAVIARVTALVVIALIWMALVYLVLIWLGLL